jgi:pimeloyl-ACP methyl ester carboxylesterase
MYDVPAQINFVLKKTGKEKLSYIGHSQGTTQMFVALTTKDLKDEIASKLNLFVAYAPITRMSHSFISRLSIL